MGLVLRDNGFSVTVRAVNDVEIKNMQTHDCKKDRIARGYLDSRNVDGVVGHTWLLTINRAIWLADSINLRH